MIESMYSGVSGLQAHKRKMDVIGNNIANVNTVGFKQSDVSFKEAIVTTLRSPLPGTPGMQTGLGVQLGQITRNFGGGALMETGRSTNLAVSGDGFFVVASDSPQTQLLNAANRLETITAANKGTYNIDVKINGQTYPVAVDLRAGETPQEIVDKLNQQISGILQGDGYTPPTVAVPAGEILQIKLNGTDYSLNTGPLDVGATAAQMVDALNAALVAQVPPINTVIFVEGPAGEIRIQPEPSASGSVDSLGISNSTFSRDLGLTTGKDVLASNISDSVSFDLNLGQVRLAPKVGDFDFNALSIADGDSNPGAMSVLGFNSKGASATFDADAVYYTRAGDFVLDVPTGPNGAMNLITTEGRRLQGVMGSPPAAFGTNTILEDIDLRRGLTDSQLVTTFAIGLDGTIQRSVDGGPMTTIGQIALASPINPAGLEAVGSNLYRPMDAAGLSTFRAPGSQGNGLIYQGYVENSNVDLAQEFTNMIVTQRGFQANSRTISTSDDMLQELLTLKR